MNLPSWKVYQSVTLSKSEFIWEIPILTTYNYYITFNRT